MSRPAPPRRVQIVAAALAGDARLLLRSRNRDLTRVLKQDFSVASPKQQSCGVGVEGSPLTKRVLTELLLNHGHMRRCGGQPARTLEATSSSTTARTGRPACGAEFDAALLPYKWLPGASVVGGAAEYAAARLGGLRQQALRGEGPKLQRRVEISHVMDWVNGPIWS